MGLALPLTASRGTSVNRTYCLCKHYGPASPGRDALVRAWSGWASAVVHGPRHEPDRGSARSRTTGRATSRVNHFALVPLDQLAADNDTCRWSLRPCARGACSRSHAPTAARLGTGLGRPEPTHRWTEQYHHVISHEWQSCHQSRNSTATCSIRSLIPQGALLIVWLRPAPPPGAQILCAPRPLRPPRPCPLVAGYASSALPGLTGRIR